LDSVDFAGKLRNKRSHPGEIAWEGATLLTVKGHLSLFKKKDETTIRKDIFGGSPLRKNPERGGDLQRENDHFNLAGVLRRMGCFAYSKFATNGISTGGGGSAQQKKV